MIEKILWICGSSIYIILAGMHLLYTFFTNKFSVRDRETEERMKRNYPVLTNKTTMWKAWIGFNGSHSIGGIFFGVINLVFAVNYFELLGNSMGLLLLTCATSFFYLFLGFKYWFVIPRTGILVASVCFGIATIFLLIK
ncbi:MAG: hypothetical protein ABIT05_00650 [Chitinophagaceae bacterium]